MLVNFSKFFLKYCILPAGVSLASDLKAASVLLPVPREIDWLIKKFAKMLGAVGVSPQPSKYEFGFLFCGWGYSCSSNFSPERLSWEDENNFFFVPPDICHFGFVVKCAQHIVKSGWVERRTSEDHGLFKERKLLQCSRTFVIIHHFKWSTWFSDDKNIKKRFIKKISLDGSVDKRLVLFLGAISVERAFGV